MISNQKMKFKRLFNFSILVMKLKNEKQKISRFVLFLNQKTNYTFGTRIDFDIEFGSDNEFNSNIKFDSNGEFDFDIEFDSDIEFLLDIESVFVIEFDFDIGSSLKAIDSY